MRSSTSCAPAAPGAIYLFWRLRLKGTWTLLLRALHLAERDESPDEGDEPVGHLGAVVPVSGEVGGEIPFLLLESPDDQNQQRDKEDESPPGSQREGNAQKQQQPSAIHGVADERIRPGRDDGLLWLHGDRCGSKRVGAKHQPDQKQSTGDQQIPEQHDEDGDV